MGPTFAAEDARSQVECGVQGHLATRRPPGVDVPPAAEARATGSTGSAFRPP